MKKKLTLREEIELNALMMLCLYGVPEKIINDDPQPLKVFLDIVLDLINDKYENKP